MPPLWTFLVGNWPIVLTALLGMTAIYLLLPRARRTPPLWGAALCGVALVLGAWLLFNRVGLTAETVAFYTFAGLAVLAGVMMIAHSNPVYAALSFALVVLSTCGLFLLQAAPFLMAATIIVYAGAIIVTFLFVIMLAQQEGFSDADRRSREPFFTTVTGFLLLASLFWVLQRTYDTSHLQNIRGFIERARLAGEAGSTLQVKQALGDNPSSENGYFARFEKAIVGDKDSKPAHKDEEELLAALQNASANPVWVAMDDLNALTAEAKRLYEAGKRYLDAVENNIMPGSLVSTNEHLSNLSGARPNPAEVRRNEQGKTRMPANNVAALGKALYTDYLLPVQLAGALLLIATIGAIVIAGRRTEGLR
jgi:NADH-quinone oxidoreductase subunit J